MPKIYLTAIDDSLADAWTRHCSDLPDVVIHRGNILDLPVDAVVSPANSFGFMDGGIDAGYSDFFGRSLQKRLQERIRTYHSGELLVGTADIVPTHHPVIPFLIAAPTMRVPMILRESVNAYLAARAVLLLLNGTFVDDSGTPTPVSSVISSVAFPGLGTGIGGIGPDTCAHQFSQAYRDALQGPPEYPRTWAEASQRHQLLYTNRVRNLQKP